MTYDNLTVNPCGMWSQRQARAVLAIVNPQARPHGLVFAPIDVTAHDAIGDWHRFILVAYCVEHEIAVLPNNVCPQCEYRSTRRG